MSVWTKVMGSAGAPAWGKNPVLAAAVKYAGYLALGIAMGAGRLFSACGPFGAAAAAAAGPGLPGLFCMIGAAMGYFISGGAFGSLRYIATTAVVYTVGTVTRALKTRDARWFMPLVTAAVTAASGALYAGTAAVGGLPVLVRLFLEVVLGGGCAFFFGLVLCPESLVSEAAELRRSISFAITAACALMGLASIRVLGVLSVGRFLSAAAVMAAGFCGGPLTGCTAGAAMGLGMDLAGGESLFFAASYALAGLLAGSLYRYGRLTFSVSFCAGNAVAVLLGWDDGAHIPALYECFAAAVVFMLLPQAALTPVGTLLRVGKGRGETAFRMYQAERLERLALGFRALYETAAQSAPERARKNDVTAVFDRAADVVCRSCAGKDKCWKQDHAETVRSLASIAESMTRRGSISAADLPVAFRQKCVAPEGFASAVNGELRGLLYRRQYAARLREGRAAAYGQFLDMAEVINDAAKQLSGAAGPDTQAERRLIRYLKSRELDGVCAAFRDGRGRLHASIEGAGAEELADEPDWLERISAALGARMCAVSTQERGRVVLRQAEPLAVSVGIASMKKEGESVSGDRGTYFKTENGLLCVILSDGMGTGAEAAQESACAVDILESLLRAGAEPGCAMRLLNSAAMLRNGEEWGYATVDLCCIDLFTGQTCFYKYGAAPSYVKTGRAVRRLKCSSLAAGMLAGEGSAPDMVQLRLRPGHIALIASDGVLAERHDQWLRDILSASDGVEAKEVARRTLRAAVSRFGSADDMTALAIRVEERQ